VADQHRDASRPEAAGHEVRDPVAIEVAGADRAGVDVARGNPRLGEPGVPEVEQDAWPATSAVGHCKVHPIVAIEVSGGDHAGLST